MFSKVLLVFSLTSVALATVFVTSPVASTTFTGGQSAQIVWQEGGAPVPSLSTFGLAKISIYVGNAQQQTSVQLLQSNVDVSQTMSISATIDPTIGPDGSDYFIRVESTTAKDSNGTDYLAFSAKFTLTGMTGTFTPAELSQIAGQSTAPLAGSTASSTSATGPTSSLSLTTSITPTHTTSSTPSATKAASGAMSVKAGWVGLVFGALVGVTVF